MQKYQLSMDEQLKDLPRDNQLKQFGHKISAHDLPRVLNKLSGNEEILTPLELYK